MCLFYTLENASLDLIIATKASIICCLKCLEKNHLSCHDTKIFYKFYSGSGIDGEMTIFASKQLPIPKILKPEQQPFIDVVNKILAAKKQGQDTSALETQIDQMVYNLYNLMNMK